MDVIIPVKENGEWRAKMKPGYQMCPHLSYDGSEACCAVHDEPIYDGSPCWTYGNSDVDPDFIPKKGRPCPIGQLHQANGGLQDSELVRAGAPQELEDLGPWPEAGEDHG